jgi:hypothetical protein
LLWQNAVDTYNRRAANPRFIPGARVEYPDAPDLLERELLSPFRRGSSAGGGSTQPVQNRLISNAGNAWMVNPVTGEATQVIKTPPKAEARKINLLQKTMLDDLNDQIKLKRKASEEIGSAVDSKGGLPLNFELQNQLVGLERKRNKVVSDFMQSTPAAPAKRGWGYIGTGGGENLYSDATGMTDAPTVAPGFDWSNPGVAPAAPQAVQAPADLLQPTERGFPVNDALSPVPGPQAAPVNEAQSTPVAPSEPPSVISQADFNKLPSGATYLNKGKLHRKP